MIEKTKILNVFKVSNHAGMKDGFWFQDETGWMNGPYDTAAEAYSALKKYCEENL